MSSYFNNIKEIVDAKDTSEDRGDLVQTILIVAIFATLTIVVLTLIGNAVSDKGDEISKSIKDSDVTFKPKS